MKCPKLKLDLGCFQCQRCSTTKKDGVHTKSPKLFAWCHIRYAREKIANDYFNWVVVQWIDIWRIFCTIMSIAYSTELMFCARNLFVNWSEVKSDNEKQNKGMFLINCVFPLAIQQERSHWQNQRLDRHRTNG